MLFAFQIVNTQTTLSVTWCVPTTDRMILSGEFTSPALVTLIGLKLCVMEVGDFFYLATTWQYSTESKVRSYGNCNINGFTNWYSNKVEY